MNTASLENCKKLYELSGWEDVSYSWVRKGDSKSIIHRSHSEYAGVMADADFANPAYDLGYLLRELPAKIPSNEHSNNDWLILEKIVGAQDGDWVARYGTQYIYQSDTPEDCCALLAIKLIEEGIINVEAS